MTTHFSLKHAFSLLLATFFLVSCNKETVIPPVTDPVPSGNLLHKVTLNNTDSMVFDYNIDGKLRKITSTAFEEGNGPATFNFQYDAAGRIKEITSNASVRYGFIYEGDVLKMTENFIGNEKVSENNFVWNGDRIISNTVFMAIPQGDGSVKYKPTFKAMYQYDAAGLLKKLATFTVNKNTFEATLINERVIEQVDDNYNPLSIMEPLNLVAFSEIQMPRNIIKESLYDGQGVKEEVTENSFVFDSQKKVISAVSNVSEPGHTPTSIAVKYYYK